MIISEIIKENKDEYISAFEIHGKPDEIVNLADRIRNAAIHESKLTNGIVDIEVDYKNSKFIISINTTEKAQPKAKSGCGAIIAILIVVALAIVVLIAFMGKASP